MKVLVSGATGFLGSHLVRYLARQGKVQVFGLGRNPARAESVRPFCADFLLLGGSNTREVLRAFLERVQPQAILHLAALVRCDNEANQIDELIQANITLGTYLLQGAVENGVKCFLNTGSFWECMDQRQEYRPVDLYAATKRAFQDILAYFADANDLKAVTLVLFGSYGPGDSRPNVFRALDRSLDQRVAFSPGQQIMDLLYVEDVVRAYEAALAYLVHKKKDRKVDLIEIGSGQALTLREVAQIFGEVRGQSLQIDWGALPYRPRQVFHRCADLSAARDLLGWQPRFDLASGLRQMLAAEKQGQHP